jgi:nucleoid-associated protein YgaU
VQPGESLWLIAANTIGDPTLWPVLYRANRDQIKDPTLLYPGQKLAIPEVDPAEREEVRREAASLGAK